MPMVRCACHSHNLQTVGLISFLLLPPRPQPTATKSKMARTYGPCDFWLRRAALGDPTPSSSAPVHDDDEWDQCDDDFVVVAAPHLDQPCDDGSKNTVSLQKTQALSNNFVDYLSVFISPSKTGTSISFFVLQVLLS